MSQSVRVDAFGTDVAVLIAIFFLQWMGKPTSVNSICSYFQGDLLKSDAVKDSLLRLQNGKVLTLVISGKGIPSVFKIGFSELNTYFSSAVASPSTQYRSFQKLENLGMLRYDNGKYLFDANGLLAFLRQNGVDVVQTLKLLSDIVSMIVQRSIPLISERQFVELLDGHEFSLEGSLVTLSDDILQICQKALSSNAP